MSKDQEFRIVTDGDGHEYIVPADRYEAATGWLERAEKAYDSMDHTGEFDDVPDYFIQIDGIHQLVFKDWREAND